jgi:hypothetical protein
MMTLLRQPNHVEALTAQRHEDARARTQLQARPVFLQRPVKLRLMKADLFVLPAFAPE